MTTFRLVCLFLILVLLMAVSHAEVSDQFSGDPKRLEANVTKWDVLEAVVNQSHLSDTYNLRDSDIYRFNMWYSYKGLLRARRPDFLDEVSQTMTRISYVDSAIDMAGVILFGPEKARSTLRSKLIELDDHQCFKSTFELFKKHCGLQDSETMNHVRSFENMCNYVDDKTKIQEAFILACGFNNTEPSVIDVTNPRIQITPAPIHGSSEYCGRVSVNGILRMKLLSYAKGYRLLVLPFFDWYNKIHICFHRNASLGLCQCEKDDWRSIKKRLWSSQMSPYEHRFVDVKFNPGAFGHVTVIYNEVSRGGRYELLVGGIGFLFMAPIASNRGAQFSKWAMLILAVTCIFLSSIDTPLAIVAVGSCLALYYVIFSIMWRDDQGMKNWLFSRQTTPEIGEGGIGLYVLNEGPLKVSGDMGLYVLNEGPVNASGDIGSTGNQHEFYSTFHKTPNRKKFSKKEWEEFTDEWTRESVGELVSSSKFKDWVIGKNWADREPDRTKSDE